MKLPDQPSYGAPVILFDLNLLFKVFFCKDFKFLRKSYSENIYGCSFVDNGCEVRCGGVILNSTFSCEIYDSTNKTISI